MEVPSLNHPDRQGSPFIDHCCIIFFLAFHSFPFQVWKPFFGEWKKKKKKYLNTLRRNWNRSLQSFPNVWRCTTAKGDRSNSKCRDVSLMTSEQHRKQTIPPLSLACHEQHHASHTQQRHSINSFAQQNLCHHTHSSTHRHTPLGNKLGLMTSRNKLQAGQSIIINISRSFTG